MTDTPKKTNKKRRDLMSRIPAGFVRAVLRGHGALGLAFAALIYLVCLTGSIAVFVEEFKRWESPQSPVLTDVTPDAVQRAMEGAVARGGAGVEHVYITLPMPDLPRMSIYVDADTDTQFFADSNGRIIEGGQSAWTEFISRLHINLHLPHSWGGFIVGLVGVALLSSLISGIMAHPRIFRDAFHLRIGGSRRLQEADLHNRMGVWAMPFHILVSLTGALLGLTTIIVGVLGMAMFNGDVNKVYALFIPVPPIDDPRPAPIMDVRPMFAKVPVGQGRIQYVFTEHPTEMGGAAMFNVKQPNTMAGLDSYAFHRDGKIYHSAKASDNNLGQDILSSMSSIHFGWFGGGIIKIIYFLLGMCLTYLAVSGVYIWLARRRDKGRPAPGWEKAWASVVWGQPAGIALAALASIIFGHTSPAIITWLISTALFSMLAFFLSPETQGRIGRAITGAGLILTPIAHLVILNGKSASDPVVWLVNGTLLLSGLWFLHGALPRSRQIRLPSSRKDAHEGRVPQV